MNQNSIYNMESTKNQLNLFTDLNQEETNKFLEYHKKNPKVYETFKKLVFESKKIGHKRFSARGLFQVMRWKMGGKIKDDGYKFNNNHTPYYVRLFEKEHPEFVGFFEKRTIKKDLITSNL